MINLPQNGIVDIVSDSVGQHMDVFIQSTLFPGERQAHLNKKIAELNERLRIWAGQTESVTYIDLNVGLAPDSLLRTPYSLDGVHLTGDGYAIWRDQIRSAILN